VPSLDPEVVEIPLPEPLEPPSEQDEPAKPCPAPLSRSLDRAIEEIGRATFQACDARDYGRVDVRIDRDGRPWVLEINSMASLGARGSYVHAAHVAGYTFDELAVDPQTGLVAQA
jgi:D-alanine-D-alanine ligase-like ATP-grasp enzyme